MKQRTTFLLDSLEAIDTDNAVFSKELVKMPGSLFRARQDRLTVNYDELPEDMLEMFQGLYMFRVQWSCLGAESYPIFQNFGVDGFSVHLIPTSLDYEPTFDRFGSYLKKHFGVGFNNTQMISTATSATFHSTAQIKTSTFQNFLNQMASRLDRISFVQSFDIRWEKQTLIIEWISDPYEANIRQSNIRKEVALFQSTPLSLEDIELSGIRTVISEDEYVPPTKTLLIVKPRHQLLKSTINYAFSTPMGLHPSLQVRGLEDADKPHPNCEMFLFSTLPNTLFFDKYQYNSKAMSLLSNYGESDLEAPVWKVDKFGSAQLFHITNHTSFDLPLHSRYTEPSSPSTFNMITPEVFWGCDAEEFMEPEELERIDGNPFESYNLGYESFFEPSTVFYHFKKNVSKLEYKIPTADAKDSGKVQYITAGAVLLGTIYLLIKLFSAFTKTNRLIPKEKKK